MNYGYQVFLLAEIVGHKFVLILACAGLALLHHIEIKRARLKVVVVGLHAPTAREKEDAGARAVVWHWYLANAFI